MALGTSVGRYVGTADGSSDRSTTVHSPSLSAYTELSKSPDTHTSVSDDSQVVPPNEGCGAPAMDVSFVDIISMRCMLVQS